MGKERVGIKEKAVASLQIVSLVVSFLAFSYFIYSVDIVSGSMPSTISLGNKPPQMSIPSGGSHGHNRDDGSMPSSINSPGGSVQNKESIGSSYSSNLLGFSKGGTSDALASGLQWAAIAYYAGTMLGDMFGMTEKNSKALGMSLAAGLGTYKTLDTFAFENEFGAQYLGQNFGVIGLGVGVLIFVLMYKDVETQVVTFDCMPWQAPSGGDSCDVCNDADLPCSEYRCKALGQSCEIVNEGTEEEKCVYVNPTDVNPPIIKPNYDELSKGHEYKNVKSSPPGPGFNIVNVATKDGCLKAFTPLEMGLVTDEPAQCKIDFNHTTKFDDMTAFFGGSNLYSYNHSEAFSLPEAAEIEGSGFVLENGKDMVFYVRCKDKNGNENSAEYAVKFCVDPSPDTTAPRIDATSILNGGCVAEDVDSAEVVFYVNEPSECKWSFQDQDYDLMESDMSCSSSYQQVNALQLFGCSAELTGIPRDGTSYYVRCKDQPRINESDRNENRESFEFSSRGSTALVLKNLQPNGSISGGVSPVPIELYAETMFGCNEGRSVCGWSGDGSNYIQFFDTDKEDGIHTQRLDLVDGKHKYYVKCVDEGGNLVEDSVEFEVDIDSNPPMIARVYEEGDMLKIVTIRDSECSYSFDDCDFSVAQGVEMPYGNTTIHIAEWNEDKTYYIKCRDEFLNEGAEGSLVVRPTSNFL
ncbi:hypothetical protein HOB04_03500 [archaeon]|nr:hypothetical protein [archaeon]